MARAEAASLDVTNPPPQAGALAELLPDGLVVVDHGGLIKFVSNRAARLVESQPEALMNRPVREAFPLHDIEGRSWWDYADPSGYSRLSPSPWPSPRGGEGNHPELTGFRPFSR